ncbi:CAP-Gly domain-containing protein [Xylariales sp. PMI_506]|nr:CAP-Gly domain-containing protein [Xylariales sp. PMI_506]
MSEIKLGQFVASNGKQGIVRFVGQTAFAPGDWVGLELEDDSGKNDGSVKGERYFDCAPGRGMFVKTASVTVIRDAPPPRTKPTPKPSRPSVSATPGGRPNSMTDPAAGRRMSLNAPSPSPVPRTSRPSSIARSPTKDRPMISTATSSATTSRTGTPSNAARGSAVGARPRPSTMGPSSRTSMGPPPLPSSTVRSARPSSVSSSTTGSAAKGAGLTRVRSGRLSTTGPTTGRASLAARPAGGRVLSGDSLSGNESGADLSSPRKSDDEKPISPSRARTQALNKLTGPKNAASGAATTKAAASSAKPAANTTASRENQDLKAQIKILERNRSDDREKMKELEKLQEQNEKFISINKKIESKFQSAAQENSSLRKQLKEAEDRLESVEALQAEHDSLMELATLDREMAEETAEVLKLELDAIKRKAEDLELEVEVLREENAEFERGMTSEEKSSSNWIQMERHNERLREALIKLRDVSVQQNEDQLAQIKVMQQDLEEAEAIKEQYEIAKEKLLLAESRAEDLREQLDNALGAEDIIEKLSEENGMQSEQIAELRAVIQDLEELRDINDELEVNHNEHEKELQEAIDMKDSIIAKHISKHGKQQEYVEDLEYTLSRFRELVTSLQTDLDDMRASHAVNEAEAEQLNSKSRAMMDLNLKLQISAAKTQVKTIDLELQRMNAQEAQQHLDIVKLFLPETYESDKYSVLALLRFGRLAFKANILHGFVKERISAAAHPGHEDDIFAGCDALDKLTWVSSMCNRFVNAISHCSLEEFAKFEGAMFELEPVERALNNWIDGLRRDELKEKQCADELSRTIALMSHLGEVHISDSLECFADKVQMQTIMMQSHLESAATTFAVLKDMIQRAVPAVGENDELAQHFDKKADAVISHTRGVKVLVSKALHALEDLKARHLALTPETTEIFEQCETTTQELAAMARKIGTDLHALTSEEGRAEPLTYSDIEKAVHQTAMNSFSSSETDLFSTYLSKTRILTGQIADLAAVCADLSQTQEFDRSTEPWILRAQELKALKIKPADTEEELRVLKEQYNEARLAVAVREENLSTSALRIETLEARMRDANAKASRITDLEAQILESQGSMIQLKEDIEKQDRELKALETDRDKWKKMVGESRALTDGSKSGSVGNKVGREQAVATAREMDALRSDIANLQAAVRYLREDNRRARVQEQYRYDWLSEPLQKPTPVSEQRRTLVATEGKDVLGELLKMATSAKVYDLKSLPQDRMAWRPARSTPQYHSARQAEDFAAWKSWQNAVVSKAKVVVGTQSVKREGFEQREALRKMAARLRIQLPDSDGKVIPGHGQVQIVGSREWEGLQGRVVDV